MNTQATRPIESITVLYPTYNGGELFERSLAALRRQVCSLPWDVYMVDSGSSDQTLELLRAAAADFPVPFRFDSIHSLEFDHGDTRNRMVTRTRGDLCVFLTQDAIPASDDWLERLLRNFEDSGVAAAYVRNVPRDDADPVTKVLSADDPGYRADGEIVMAPPDWDTLDPHSRRLLANFNTVAAAVRREVWELCPFPRAKFGEDVMFAHVLLEAGWKIAYDAEAVVLHSHDYGPEETRRRARTDAEFSALWLNRISIASAADAQTMTERFRAPDRAGLIGLGLSGPALEDAVQRAEERRKATFEGLFEGSHVTRREQIPGVLTKHRLNLLFVVHGFPPETRAGTEVYTLHLAQALQRRGHAVTILARAELSPADAQGTQPYVEEGTWEGLRVLRLRRALDHGSLRATWDDKRIEALFDQLLDRERFDVVHFQHLIHLSATLVERARAYRCATIAHLHDYWGLCARVQLIRPDGGICPTNMGLGCLACVKEKAVGRVPLLARLGRYVAPAARLLARLFGASKPEPRSRRTFLRRLLADFSDLDERGDRILGALGQADLVVSPSRFLREKYLATEHFHAHRLVFSPNGLAVDGLPRRPRTANAADGVLDVGFVGSLLWYKGLEVLIDAVRAGAAANGSALRLHVHGVFTPADDPHHAELARRAEGLPIEFHGSFGDAERGAVYAGLDVLVVPSVWFENSPVTIHEAWHSGTAVVASRLGGMAELIEEGVSGLLFEPGNAADLAACLRRLVAEPELARTLAAGAPAVKTIDEDAADHEYRYRGLVARLPRA